jgi:hypothetical protein
MQMNIPGALLECIYLKGVSLIKPGLVQFSAGAVSSGKLARSKLTLYPETP